MAPWPLHVTLIKGLDRTLKDKRDDEMTRQGLKGVVDLFSCDLLDLNDGRNRYACELHRNGGKAAIVVVESDLRFCAYAPFDGGSRRISLRDSVLDGGSDVATRQSDDEHKWHQESDDHGLSP